MRKVQDARERSTRVERYISLSPSGIYIVRIKRRLHGHRVEVRRRFRTLTAARAYVVEMDCARATMLARRDIMRLTCRMGEEDT